jgi:hypothetical protein
MRYLLSAILLNNQEVKQENIQEIVVSEDILHEVPEQNCKCGSTSELITILPDPSLEYNDGVGAIQYQTLLNSPRVDNVIVTVYPSDKDKFI